MDLVNLEEYFIKNKSEQLYINRKVVLVICPILRKLKYVLLFLCFIFYKAVFILAQNINEKDKIEVKCILPTATIRNNQDLKAKIVIKNNSNSKIIVYSELQEGIFNNILNDNAANLRLVVQRKRSNVFQNYLNKVFVDPPPTTDTTDKLVRITLLPKDSVTNYFHVDSRYGFDAGDYRMKCLYWNNAHINKSIESNWVHFRVAKSIYVKHYFNELPKTDSAKHMQ